MDVRINENHIKVVQVSIEKRQLEEIILQAIANQTGISLMDLKQYGKLKIEQNMEGSPAYHSGYKASYRGNIDLSVNDPMLQPLAEDI